MTGLLDKVNESAVAIQNQHDSFAHESGKWDCGVQNIYLNHDVACQIYSASLYLKFSQRLYFHELGQGE